jgi:DNA-binding protein HU-beta
MNLRQKIDQLLEITGTPPDKRDLARKNYERLAQEKGEKAIDARVAEFTAMEKDVAAWRRDREARVQRKAEARVQRRVTEPVGPVLSYAYGNEVFVPKATRATPTTVTIKHLAASLAASHEVTKRQAETILNDLVGLLVKHLKKGERIRMTGLGILQVRKRAARIGRNPATGEPIKIKASKKVAFRTAKDLKEAV